MYSNTSNYFYQQVNYVRLQEGKATISYCNQWSSTSVESMTVYKHPAEATSYNQNNNSANNQAVLSRYNQNYTSAAKTPAEATSDRLYNTLAAKTQAEATSDRLYNTSAAKTPAVVASDNIETGSVKIAEKSEKRNPTTCEIYISRYFAGEDIGVNGLERWLSENKQNFD